MEYSTYSFRFIHMGLNLRNAVDKVGEGQWQVLTNIDPTREGSLETRPGRVLFIDTASATHVHSLKHYSATELLVGAGDTLYRNASGLNLGWSGNPLSIISFLPPAGGREWFYVADTTMLRKVSSDAAITTFKWGIDAPAAALVFTASATAGSKDSAVANATVYDFRATYYSSSSGAESNPSPTAAGIAITGANSSATVNVVASGDPQVTNIRIYQRGGVNDLGSSVWRLCKAVANTTAAINEGQADSVIALNLAMEEDNYVPFQSVNTSGNALTVNLPYAWGPFLAKYILACGDTFRPGDLYWTNADRPDSADIANHVSVSPPGEPLLGGVVYNGQPFAFTTDNLYAIDFGGANALPTFIGRKTPCGRGTVSPWSFTVGPMIYFINASGIYQTTGLSEAESLTEEHLRPIFDEQSPADPGGEALSPISLTTADAPFARLAYENDDLHFFYRGQNGSMYHFVYNTLYKRWHREATAVPAAQPFMGYLDENQAKARFYLGGNTGDVYYEDRDVATDNSTFIAASATTGVLDFGLPQTLKELGNIIVDASGTGDTTLTVELYDVNGVLLVSDSTILTGGARRKVTFSLEDIYTYGAAVRLSWSGPNAQVYGMDLLWRPDKPEITHWNFGPTSHSLSGWQHVRDAYICLRSTADATLTVICDATTDTYTVPSTGGEKRKVYVPLSPRKGKVWQWQIDSSVATTPFRLYGEDCEIRSKVWTSALGYQLLSPFAPQG